MEDIREAQEIVSSLVKRLESNMGTGSNTAFLSALEKRHLTELSNADLQYLKRISQTTIDIIQSKRGTISGMAPNTEVFETMEAIANEIGKSKYNHSKPQLNTIEEVEQAQDAWSSIKTQELLFTSLLAKIAKGGSWHGQPEGNEKMLVANFRAIPPILPGVLDALLSDLTSQAEVPAPTIATEAQLQTYFLSGLIWGQLFHLSIQDLRHLKDICTTTMRMLENQEGTELEVTPSTKLKSTLWAISKSIQTCTRFKTEEWKKSLLRESTFILLMADIANTERWHGQFTPPERGLAAEIKTRRPVLPGVLDKILEYTD